MSKEKQIEEMAKDMCEYYYEGTCYQDKKPCDCKCDIFTDAQYLYSKGYRKSEDVAREIFAEIEKRLGYLADESKMLRDNETNLGEKTQLNGEWIGVRLALKDIAKLEKKYTEGK